MDTLFTDEYFMRKALDEAAAALEEDEIPIGAVVVHNQKIIGKGITKQNACAMLQPMQRWWL